jgi:hypothetical protein
MHASKCCRNKAACSSKGVALREGWERQLPIVVSESGAWRYNGSFCDELAIAVQRQIVQAPET